MSYPTSPDTSLYLIARGKMYAGAWSGSIPPNFDTGLTELGNVNDCNLVPTEEALDHYSTQEGVRNKDLSITLEEGYTLEFELDEISLFNIKMFFRATQSGNELRAMQALSKNYAIKVVNSNPNEGGPVLTWKLWKVKLSPNGPFSLITSGEDWSVMSFTGEGLSDTANHATSPYFSIVYATTTTT